MMWTRGARGRLAYSSRCGRTTKSVPRPPRCAGDCPCVLSLSASTVRLGQDRYDGVCARLLTEQSYRDRMLHLVSPRRQATFSHDPTAAPCPPQSLHHGLKRFPWSPPRSADGHPPHLYTHGTVDDKRVPMQPSDTDGAISGNSRVSGRSISRIYTYGISRRHCFGGKQLWV
jgi:hypothetical protein